MKHRGDLPKHLSGVPDTDGTYSGGAVRTGRGLSENSRCTGTNDQDDGCQMRTGFVGTPYILHVLSNYGYTDLAYTLLCRKEYPSWLYAVGKGATTIWEHWDGIMETESSGVLI